MQGDADTRSQLDTSLVDAARRWSLAHPRMRLIGREAWALSRRAAQSARLPHLLEPAELRDLDRLGVADMVARTGGETTPRILFLTFRGWSTHLLWEVTFAHAARLRGAAPVFASCGGRLPVCDAANVHAAPPMPCLSCSGYARDGLERAGFRPYLLRDMVDVGATRAEVRPRLAALRTLDDLRAFRDGDLELGELVRISVLWFLARGTLADTPEVRRTYRRFLESALVLVRYFERLLAEVEPDRILALNGLFFAERILSAVAARQGIPVVTYERGYLTDTVVVSTTGPACDYVVDEASWAEARDRPLDAAAEAELDDYLGARTRGERAVDNIWRQRTEDWDRIAREIRLDTSRRFFTLFSNVVWDSAAQDKDLAFDSLPQWIVETIRGFTERPDVDLVVRLHPAEVRTVNHRSRELMADVIAAHFPHLPPNVHVIPSESTISSYALMDRCVAGLVYTSTVGLEMAVAGNDVVVAARTHYRARGFTTDVSSPEEYWAAVDSLRAGAAPAFGERVTLARRYAHLFFFRFMQHLDLVREPGRARPRLGYREVSSLRPGAHPALDRIVSGILDGAPVIAPVAGG